MQRAVGDQLTCVFVDHGLLRAGEAEQVERDFVAATGVGLKVVDAAERSWPRSPGVTDPEAKRKTIGREFIRVFERPPARCVAEAERRDGEGEVQFLVQGTLYPDVVESGGGEGAATSRATTTSAGCPTTCSSSWSSRCGRCSRTRCARSAPELGLPEEIVQRQPFPGPGLGIRIIGEVTAERLETLRAADPIVREELTARRAGPRDLAVPGGAAGRRPLGRRAGRRPHLRPPGRAAAGVVRGRDDRRLDPAALRPAGQDLDPDHQRGRGVNRVVLDITSKPPGTIEWE